MDNRFPLWEKALYRAVNTVFLVSIAIFVAGRYLGIVSTNIVHGIIAMIVLIGLTAIGNCSKKGKLFSILCLVGIGISVIIVIGMEHILRFLFSYGRWFIGKGTWEKEWLIGYELMQVVWIVLLCYGLQVLLEKIFTIKLVIAGVMVIYLVILFFLEKQLSKIGMALILSYLLFVLIEWTQRNWDKVKCQGIHSYMVWITPFLVLYLVVLVKMPVPQQPYDWKAFKNIYHKMSKSLDVLSFHIFQGGRNDYGTFFLDFLIEPS